MSKDKKSLLSEMLPLNSRKLSRAIFQMEISDHDLKALPIQTLYVCLQSNGISACYEALNSCSLIQLKGLLDLDLWRKDEFAEDNIWMWLEIEDDSEPLQFLQKLLKVFDYKLIAILIAKHVTHHCTGERIEQSPGDGFRSPDLGYTWIRVNIEDTHKYFLLNRLLALIFETDAELFYQLFAVANSQTISLLEEESFQDAQRRLESEGIPNYFAGDIDLTPISLTELQNIIEDENLSKNFMQSVNVLDIDIIEPLVENAYELNPLTNILQNLSNKEQIYLQLTRIINECCSRFGIYFSDASEVLFLASQVKGALNFAIEKYLASMTISSAATTINTNNISNIISTIGIRPFFKYALYELFELRKIALKANNNKENQEDSINQIFINALLRPLPALEKHLINPVQARQLNNFLESFKEKNQTQNENQTANLAKDSHFNNSEDQDFKSENLHSLEKLKIQSELKAIEYAEEIEQIKTTLIKLF